MTKESILAQKISNYLQLKHKDIIFRFDFGVDLKMSMFQAKRMKALQGVRSKGHPDLCLYEPKKGYHGLFIELKVVTPFKKDGHLKKNKHLETQEKYHNLLRAKGYYCCFSVGFEDTKKLIEEYLG